jgi:integrase
LKLIWIDVDLQRQCIIINETEKNGKPRAFEVSHRLWDMINALPKNSEKLFGLVDYISKENQFVVTRKKVAHELQNPRLKQIHFHTFRHWKATMEYHKTKDILYVMNLLGHRNIESTLVYTQLVSFESDGFYSAVATIVEEARKLLEQGFEYVCQKDDIMSFKKRK